MPQRITRRELLSSGIKAGIGLAVWRLAPSLTVASATTGDDKRFQPAFAHLDEFIAAHLRDIGAPGMTLALATREGLLRASTYGFADTKASAKVQPNTLFEVWFDLEVVCRALADADARRR